MLSSPGKSFLEKNKGRKIVFTNGCFDILHRGHITYLLEAKKLGDLLMIGLNSDQSVKKLKGDSRPINSEEDRKYILENLKMVDFVEIFSESTPVELIGEARPDIYVKGGDYDVTQIPEFAAVTSYGGEVKKLGFVSGYSTSATIDEMKGQS
jgi:rfaE bifunctional protein nucleotidyltransferase chain/domain